MPYVWGIDPGYSATRPSTGFVVVEVMGDGQVVAITESRHCTSAQLREEVLPRALSDYPPQLVAIDAPIMAQLTAVSPFGRVKCRPQELVSMQPEFARCRLKAGHAFTPRGLGLHEAGQAVVDCLQAEGFAFDQFVRLGELCAAARAGGTPAIVEAFPKLWLGLQLSRAVLTNTTLPENSHDRDAAMLLMLLRDRDFLTRFRLEESAGDFRIIGNGDELAAATSALSGIAALYGIVSDDASHRSAIALGSTLGGHFILPPRGAWHADHGLAMDAATITASRRAGFEGCTLLTLA